MGRIIELDERTVRMIAAGEVVERPASVVKELVENSLDAGAGSVTVEVEEGGKRLIRVTDDGSGMSHEDALLAVERHTTSKISGPGDLAAIGTLGFRGEALASIGAVSVMEVETRTGKDDTATVVQVEGARVVHVGRSGRPPGTTVTVRHIFRDVPARRKQLRHAKAELIRVLEVVGRLALSRPDVHFRLLSDGVEVLNAPPTDDELANIGHVMGMGVARDMIPVVHEGEVRIRGFIGRPRVERATSRHQHFFVNGRWVRSRELADALREGYRPRTMVGRFPPAVIRIEVPLEDVDVNVHPQKSEVRFLRGDVPATLTRAVRWALQQEFPVPELAGEVAEQRPLWPAVTGGRPGEEAGEARQEAAARGDAGTPSEDGGTATTAREGVERAMREGAGPASREMEGGAGRGRHAAVLRSRPLVEVGTLEVRTDRLPLLRILGQVRDEFIVAEGPDGVYIIDQHAAAERINLESLRGRRFGVQELIEPAYVQLDPRDAETLRSHLPAFIELGYRIEEFSDGFLVRAIPSLVRTPDPVVALRLIVEDLQEHRRSPSESALDGVLAAMACHMSIRVGDPLTMDQMASLIRRLGDLEDLDVCAHGRPTMMKITFRELERRFGRLG